MSMNRARCKNHSFSLHKMRTRWSKFVVVENLLFGWIQFQRNGENRTLNSHLTFQAKKSISLKIPPTYTHTPTTPTRNKGPLLVSKPEYKLYTKVPRFEYCEMTFTQMVNY